MPHHDERITLIAREVTRPDFDWDDVHSRGNRVAFLDSVDAICFALDASVTDIGLDVERVIIDRAGTADDFLDLLARLPLELAADVLLIRDDGRGFLSAMGRGGGRMLYALQPRDVRFYLEAHELVTGRAALELTA